MKKLLLVSALALCAIGNANASKDFDLVASDVRKMFTDTFNPERKRILFSWRESEKSSLRKLLECLAVSAVTFVVLNRLFPK